MNPKNDPEKKLKTGFTTGTCAAAAAKAATIMLFEGRQIARVSVTTPAGEIFETPVTEVMLTSGETPGESIEMAGAIGTNSVCCAVKKPESDDPDVTAGILIYARAFFSKTPSRTEDPGPDDGQDKKEELTKKEERVIITGGKGIGIVTKPGLDRPVGDYAINSVPRAMITEEAGSVLDEYEYNRQICIEISAPEGEEIAKKTFNPRLGIEGGISIIGTSGIVEPMSTKALIDTIKVELNQKKAMGESVAVISPGNYGLAFMKEHYGYDLDRAVKCSNFIGEAIDSAKESGFSELLLVGHVGKLIKLSGGIMNTHSHEADCRMELMAAAAIRAGAGQDDLEKILSCVSTEEAIAVIKSENLEEKCFEHIMERISYYLTARAQGMRTACIVYSNKYGLLGKTEGAEEMLKKQKG